MMMENIMTYKTIDDLKVGDIVHVHDATDGKHREPTVAVVTKIGTKLIYVKEKYPNDWSD